MLMYCLSHDPLKCLFGILMPTEVLLYCHCSEAFVFLVFAVMFVSHYSFSKYYNLLALLLVICHLYSSCVLLALLKMSFEYLSLQLICVNKSK